MPKYIDADAFVRLKRERYCEQCQKRKGMKRGKLQFIYEIGDAPCRACDVDDVISDIEDLPVADVEPVRHGRWIPGEAVYSKYDGDRLIERYYDRWTCSVCNYVINDQHYSRISYKRCPECGAKMQGEEEDGIL